MDKIEALEGKIKDAVKTIQHLREKNSKLTEECKRIKDENEVFSGENRQVRQLVSELDRLREERKQIKQKCASLLAQYGKMNL